MGSSCLEVIADQNLMGVNIHALSRALSVKPVTLDCDSVTKTGSSPFTKPGFGLT
jgi:hypothetical protein